MITRERIETLATFDARGARVLSLLLDLDPARQIRRSYLIAFDDLVKEGRKRLEQTAREAFLRETAVIPGEMFASAHEEIRRRGSRARRRGAAPRGVRGRHRGPPPLPLIPGRRHSKGGHRPCSLVP